MGWTWGPKPYGTLDQWLKEQLTWDGKDYSNRCLATSRVGKAMYGAVERIHKETGEREVWAAVFLIGWAPKDPHYPFGYKDMCESMGPCEARAPEKILKLLTPLPPREYDENGVEKDNSRKWSHDWRERCWAAVKASKTLKNGSYVLLNRPLTFGGGYEVHAFQVDSTVPWRVMGYSRGRAFKGADGAWASTFERLRVKFGRERLLDEVMRGARIATEDEVKAHFVAIAEARAKGAA